MIIPDPFTVTKLVLIISMRLFVATLKIVGYVFVGIFEVTWYVTHGRMDRIGEAIGRLGQATVDAYADLFTYK